MSLNVRFSLSCLTPMMPQLFCNFRSGVVIIVWINRSIKAVLMSDTAKFKLKEPPKYCSYYAWTFNNSNAANLLCMEPTFRCTVEVYPSFCTSIQSRITDSSLYNCGAKESIATSYWRNNWLWWCCLPCVTHVWRIYMEICFRYIAFVPFREFMLLHSLQTVKFRRIQMT